MATVSIPTTEPPLCPEESATAHDLMPSTSMNENITRELLFVVAAFAIAVGLALWRWQVLRTRRSATPTTSIKLKAKADFLARAGRGYGYANSKKGFIDDWRLSEFPTLIPPLTLQTKEQGDWICIKSDPEVYLDYAGSAIPTRTLLSRICSEEQILANPHSQGGGLASDRTLKLTQLAKDRAMQHFGIQHEAFGWEELDKEDGKDIACPGYQLVFTSGATESLRLVAERFPWSTARIACGEPSRLCTRGRSTVSPPQLKSMQAQSILLYPRNVHTSVIGMREVAMQRGAGFRCVPVDQLQNATSDWFQSLINASMRHEEFGNTKVQDAVQTNEEKKDDCIAVGRGGAESATSKTMWMHHLLVLPLECNFGGDRFDWSKTVAAARESCFSTYIDGKRTASVRFCHKWHILLDTAKAAATSPVDLPTLTNESGPDFAVVSFYKMFGAPTGLGALFAKKDRRRTREAPPPPEPTDTSHLTNHCISETLVDGTVLLERNHAHRQYFGGGSVDVVLPDKDFVVARNGNPTRPPANGRDDRKSSDQDENIDLGVMVHGTEHFRGIASLLHGFQEIDELGGMQAVASHAGCLAAELVRRLRKLTHDNGKPVVELYGQWRSFASESDAVDTDSLPGPTVAFNIRDRDGALIGYDEVSRLASLNCPPIQLRTGCFCNPGACQDALPLTDAEVLENYASGHVCGDRRGIVNGKPTGAIRASFGKDSTWEDMDALASFVDKIFVSREEALVQHASSGRASRDTMKIDRLYVFPIKSCAAMRVTRWPIDRRTGRLAFDREFALVDTSGSAMRLQSHSKMSEIHSSIDLNAQTLTVTAPNHEALTIDLEEPASSSRPVSPEDIQVCGVLCKGNIWGGSKAARWFSSVLGVRCWLARHYDAGETTTLADGDDRPAYCNEASLLVVSQQSVSFLNSVITAQGWGRLVEARHFRPNIVVASDCTGEQDAEEQGVANLEDAWQRITISGSTDTVELKAVGKCARCQMVDVDPTSGMKGNTLRALAQYRRDRGRINFGTFFAGRPDAPEGTAWLEESSDVRAELIPDE